MIPAGMEQEFMNFILVRLGGEALRSIEGRTFTSLSDLLAHMTLYFEQTRSLFEETGELGRIEQGPTESVVSYSNRVKELTRNILLTAEREGKPPPLNNQELVFYFKKGLKNEIRFAIPAFFPNLEEAIRKALEVERFFNRPQAGRESSTSSGSRAEEKVCYAEVHRTPSLDFKESIDGAEAKKESPKQPSSSDAWPFPFPFPPYFFPPQGMTAPSAPTLQEQPSQEKAESKPEKKPDGQKKPRKHCNYCNKDFHEEKVCRKKIRDEAFKAGQEAAMKESKNAEGTSPN